MDELEYIDFIFSDEEIKKHCDEIDLMQEEAEFEETKQEKQLSFFDME